MSRSVPTPAGTGVPTPGPTSSGKLSRRTLFAGAGTAGALAAASLVPATGEVAPVADLPKQPPERGGGYALSEHVKRYYRTTRL
jgi:hypothetical protein